MFENSRSHQNDNVCYSFLFLTLDFPPSWGHVLIDINVALWYMSMVRRETTRGVESRTLVNGSLVVRYYCVFIGNEIKVMNNWNKIMTVVREMISNIKRKGFPL